MSELSKELQLKHFQLALSMVGISANLMTCELIQSISELVDKKGMDFSLGDATKLAESIQKKYQAMMPSQPPPSPYNMMPPPNLPPEIEKLAKEGKIKMGKIIEDAVISEEK